MSSVISAISTPYGRGGVAMIRVSGHGAIEMCDKIFKGKKPLTEVDANRAVYGNIVLGGEVIDDGVFTVFRAPRSFTARITVGALVGGDPALRDMTVSFTSPDTLAGVTITATLSPATDGGYDRAVTFSYPSDYGEIQVIAKGKEFDGFLRFAEALLPLGDVTERSPAAEDGSYTVTRKTADGGREAVFIFAEGETFPRRVTLTDRWGRVELNTCGEKEE